MPYLDPEDHVNMVEKMQAETLFKRMYILSQKITAITRENNLTQEGALPELSGAYMLSAIEALMHLNEPTDQILARLQSMFETMEDIARDNLNKR